MVFMNQNVKVLVRQDKTLPIMNCGALMMMADTELKMAASLDKKLLTLEESKTLSASTEMSTRPLELEPIALALKPIMNAIWTSLEIELDNASISQIHWTLTTPKLTRIEMLIAQLKDSGTKIKDIEKSQATNAVEDKTLILSSTNAEVLLMPLKNQ